MRKRLDAVVGVLSVTIGLLIVALLLAERRVPLSNFLQSPRSAFLGPFGGLLLRFSIEMWCRWAIVRCHWAVTDTLLS